MCVELYFLVNQLMDLSVIAAVTRSLGCFQLRRALTASALAALCAVAAQCFPPLAAPMPQLLFLPAAALLAIGPAPPGLALTAMVSTFTVALGTGALGQCMSIVGFTPLLPLLPFLLSLGTRLRLAVLGSAPATVEVCRGDARAMLHACIDTGNRLTEPLSGQPVIVASAAQLWPILPTDGYRRVAYGSVGGGGTLRCFRPDAIYIVQNGRRRAAPPAWVAVYPQRLPGAYQALAPAAFALA